jgi:sugar phosphate isomerase/epimerase
MRSGQRPRRHADRPDRLDRPGPSGAEPVEGARAIRRIHRLLHPDIFWHLDVYWAQTAGADPAEVLSELMTRIGSIHWKDGPAVHGEPMTALERRSISRESYVR